MNAEILLLKTFRIPKKHLEYIHNKNPKSGVWLRNVVKRAIEAELHMQKTAELKLY